MFRNLSNVHMDNALRILEQSDVVTETELEVCVHILASTVASMADKDTKAKLNKVLKIIQTKGHGDLCLPTVIPDIEYGSDEFLGAYLKNFGARPARPAMASLDGAL